MCKVLLPLLHDELGLQLLHPVADLELHVLGTDPLVDLERGPARVVACVRPLSGEERRELVRACLEVAEPHAMHAAPLQRVDLPLRVQVVRHLLAVDHDLHGIEREEGAGVH